MIRLLQYRGMDPAWLETWMNDHDAVLVDGRVFTRMTYSDSRWTKRALKKRFDGRVLHLPELQDLVPQAIHTLHQLSTSFQEVALLLPRDANLPKTLGKELGTSIPELRLRYPIDVSDPNKLLTSTQAIAYLDVNYHSFRRYLYGSKHLAFYGRKIGHTWVFTTDSLEAFKSYLAGIS